MTSYSLIDTSKRKVKEKLAKLYTKIVKKILRKTNDVDTTPLLTNLRAI